MRMKPEHADRLLQLLQLADLSLRSRLILARRVARYICTERLLGGGCIETEKAEPKFPIVASSQLAMIKRTQSDESQLHQKILLNIGRWLCQNEEVLTEQYGFDGICDVLEVNPVHRTEVIECAKDTKLGVSAIAFISALEDSASVLSGRHPSEWKDGPLYQALREKVKQVHRVGQ